MDRTNPHKPPRRRVVSRHEHRQAPTRGPCPRLRGICARAEPRSRRPGRESAGRFRRTAPAQSSGEVREPVLWIAELDPRSGWAPDWSKPASRAISLEPEFERLFGRLSKLGREVSQMEARLPLQCSHKHGGEFFRNPRIAINRHEVERHATFCCTQTRKPDGVKLSRTDRRWLR